MTKQESSTQEGFWGGGIKRVFYMPYAILAYKKILFLFEIFSESLKKSILFLNMGNFNQRLVSFMVFLQYQNDIIWKFGLLWNQNVLVLKNPKWFNYKNRNVEEKTGYFFNKSFSKYNKPLTKWIGSEFSDCPWSNISNWKPDSPSYSLMLITVLHYRVI